ncbi:hypothetical protein C8A05DRAFT_17459 [Staphylotrichum tortipilum]|uniref:DUF7730 domain-containing protein n=1 Tax=Staphylotrichum tortipilum TaxID=2831512 RepID=A0AAN6MHH7_9PEZI|nr:hypothetical protein C8A05DRAFT_17459 [Staphylotrichum longicolle]
MATIPPPNGSLPGLLRLEPDTRRLIYEHAGMASRLTFDGQSVPALYNLGNPSSFTEWREASGPEGFQTFHGLLLTCRTIYTEASALLYSANWFIIHYPPRRTLAALRALTPHALAHLTHLKIVLNQSSYNQDRGNEVAPGCCGADAEGEQIPCRDDWHRVTYYDSPLYESGVLCTLVSSEWSATAAHLAAHIVPGQLELSLVYDIAHGDLEAAQLILDSLRQLPPLKDCHLRLCGTRDPGLQQLAQEAVLRARGITPPEPPGLPSRAATPSSHAPLPHLLMLPPELRLRILEYTDLVTPWKEVYWSRLSRYGITRARCEEQLSGNKCPQEFHGGCQFAQCRDRTPWPHPSIGCFCRRTHTAASSACRCWAPPTALLLVCKTLYSEANRVLYSKNRFVIIDSRSESTALPWYPRDYPHQSFAASHFLRHVVPRHCLWHIRFLEVVFAPFSHAGRPRVGHPAFQDWAETLDWARHELNLPVLTVRLVMARNTYPPQLFGIRMTKDHGRSVLDAYNSIVYPLRRLDPTSTGGLARFYAELAWPLEYTNTARPKPPGWLKGKERELKRRAEQYVMGERYESVCAVADQPHESVWIRRDDQERYVGYYS